MSSRIRPGEEPGLFDDLPLRSQPTDSTVSSHPIASGQTPVPMAEPEPLPLFADSPGDRPVEPVRIEPAQEEVTRPSWRPPIPPTAQISASLLDLGVLLAVGVILWLGLVGLGVELDRMSLGYLALFFLPFSFLYQVFPLAFWGRTPGMARVGLVARGRDGRSLTFSQAGLRWTASLLTVLMLGLPLLTTQLTGRSLADRLSDSQTLPAR